MCVRENLQPMTVLWKWSTSADFQYRSTFLLPSSVSRPTVLFVLTLHLKIHSTAFDWQLIIITVAIHHRAPFPTDLHIVLVSSSYLSPRSFTIVVVGL